jgi:uncharacterized protein
MDSGRVPLLQISAAPLIGGLLRTALYPHLANIANGWNERMGIDQRYPELDAEFLKQCRAQGQTRPTPLLLQYVPGDFNCLHQDLYGDLALPIAILFSEPGSDFTGGEFVLTEQRPRMPRRWVFGFLIGAMLAALPVNGGQHALMTSRERT